MNFAMTYLATKALDEFNDNKAEETIFNENSVLDNENMEVLWEMSHNGMLCAGDNGIYSCNAIPADWWELYKQSPDFVDRLFVEPKEISLWDAIGIIDDCGKVVIEDFEESTYAPKKSTKRYDIRDKARHGQHHWWGNVYKKWQKKATNKKVRHTFEVGNYKQYQKVMNDGYWF